MTQLQQTRQKGESTKAHQAYLDYREMGVGRSLRKLQELYTCEDAPHAPDNLPTKHITTIERWSSRYDWQTRIIEWEAYLQAEREAAAEKARQDEREKRARLLEKMRDKVEKQMMFADLSNEVGIKAFNAMTRAFKAYMDMSMKQYNDLPTEKTDLTSGGQTINVSFTDEVIPQSAIDKRLEALGLSSVVEAHE